jgi:NADP-dependent 3-hydroxy acid dehydrogenase YdfG
MRIDLLGTPLRVSLVSPGLVNTEFSTVRFHGDYERGQKTYDGMRPLVAEDIAEGILYAVTAPEHVNVEEVLIMPRQQAGVAFVDRSGAK